MSTSSYAAGSKVYRGGSSAPNIGPVTDKTGYEERDRKYKTRRRNNALLRRIQAGQGKNYMSSNYLSSPQNRTL
jgi:hypothetical protein